MLPIIWLFPRDEKHIICYISVSKICRDEENINELHDEFSPLAFSLPIPWSASKTIWIVSFRNNVRSNVLLFSPWKFSRADWRDLPKIFFNLFLKDRFLNSTIKILIVSFHLWSEFGIRISDFSMVSWSCLAYQFWVKLIRVKIPGLQPKYEYSWYPILEACCKEILNCKGNIRGHEMIHPYRQFRILWHFHPDIFWHEILHTGSSRLLKNCSLLVVRLLVPLQRPFSIFLQLKMIWKIKISKSFSKNLTRMKSRLIWSWNIQEYFQWFKAMTHTNQSNARMIIKNVGETHENSANIVEPKSVPDLWTQRFLIPSRLNSLGPLSKKLCDMIGWYIANIFMVIQKCDRIQRRGTVIKQAI